MRLYLHSAVVLLAVVCQATENAKFLYFAYGSNLLSERIHIRNPTAVFKSSAMLPGYRLDFNMYEPSWRGAVATIAEDPASSVWGALWLIDRDQMAALDKQEGVDEGEYYAADVTVTNPDGSQSTARTYIETHNPTKLQVGQQLPLDRRPSNTYMQVIIYGAIQCRLPANYVDFLYTFPTNGKLASDEIRQNLGYPFNSKYNDTQQATNHLFHGHVECNLNMGA